jgi:hypothetical protein
MVTDSLNFILTLKRKKFLKNTNFYDKKEQKLFLRDKYKYTPARDK